MTGDEVFQAYTTYRNLKKMYVNSLSESFDLHQIERAFQDFYSQNKKVEYHIVVHKFAAHADRLGISASTFKNTYTMKIIPILNKLIEEQGLIITRI